MERSTIGCLKSPSRYKHSLIDKVTDYRVEDLVKLSNDQIKEIKQIAKQYPDSKLLVALEHLRKVAKTSKSIGKQCGIFDCNEDANANAAEDETAESSLEIPVDPSKEHKCFRVMMDVSNFLPEKVDVKIVGKHLVIHAKHEMLVDDHGRISREFTRKFEIPKDVDIETARALIDCYGVLTFEASYKPMEVEEKNLSFLTDTNGRTSVQPYGDLGQEFLDLAKLQIKDWEDMRDFAEKLAKQRPSDYIPYEEVV